MPRHADPWEYDSRNPRNWSTRAKWGMTAMVALYAFVTPLGSSMMAPGLPDIAVHYHIGNPTVLALTLSIYLLAFAVGPLLIGPLSEIYGRVPVLHISNIVFLVFSLACAFAPDTASLIIFRFLAGLGGGAPASIGGACIGDLFAPSERANAMSIYTLGPLLGGFISETIGFRYIFIILAALAGASAAIGLPFLRETYAPVIQNTRMSQESKSMTGASSQAHSQRPIVRPTPLTMAMTVTGPPSGPSKKEILLMNLTRPIMILTRSFVGLMMSLYMALLYGFLYLLFTTFPDLFSQTYGWGPGISGLAYLGPGIGLLASTSLGAWLMTKIYNRLTARNGGVSKPEFRIPSMAIGTVLVPVGLLWYGWSAQQRLHWSMPIIGSGVFAFGLMWVYIPVQLYLVDSFQYAASALAAAAVCRCLFAFCFPLFGEDLYQTLGIGWGNTLLAGLVILIGVPFPPWVYYKGEAMRAKSKLTR
ncbi:hypothetical protein M422DRAFT_57770 [Sphaerobolus stellatus SS14]|nr:hypothetical protein M422DRAFT_57770 [Sphaerobolus stellatus SS14]